MLCLLLPAWPAAAAAPDTLTVVTLNLWHDQADWPRRRALVLEGLRALRPDVVCLQEVLQHATLPNQAHSLAESLGFRVHFTSVDAETSAKRYGNAILTPHPVLLAGGRALDPADDYRTVAHVRIRFAGREVDVYDTHLHHTGPGARIRARQVRDLLGFVGATRGVGPVVLAGDFNTRVESWELGPVRAAFLDAFAAARPRLRGDQTTTLNPAHGHRPRRIDHVFVARDGTPALTPASAEILFREPRDGVWASDHFGVVVRLVLGGRRDVP